MLCGQAAGKTFCSGDSGGKIKNTSFTIDILIEAVFIELMWFFLSNSFIKLFISIAVPEGLSIFLRHR